MSKYCPSCAEKVCPPYRKSKDLLIIGEFPSSLEMRTGIPFSSNGKFGITAGHILRKELQNVSLEFSMFTVMNLWMHEPNKNENCWQAGYNLVLEEAKGKKAVLLVGSDVVETFTNYKVSEVSGLQVDSSILSAPLIMCSVNPALSMHRAVGEVRFAITKWAEALERNGLV